MNAAWFIPISQQKPEEPGRGDYSFESRLLIVNGIVNDPIYL
jgi:hypothetical protein